jgi:hypothetical protein
MFVDKVGMNRDVSATVVRAEDDEALLATTWS